MPSVGETLARSARRAPEREALVYGPRRYTYAELDAEVNRAANALASRGLSRGERLALMSPNTEAFVVSFYAALRLGAIVVPVNPRSAPPELAYILADSGAKFLFFDPALTDTVEAALGEERVHTQRSFSTRPLAGYEDLPAMSAAESAEPPAVEVGESDDAEILYTSGTTGNPKGVLLDHHRVVWVALNAVMGVGLFEGERMLHVAPLYHSAELNLFLVSGTMLAGTHVLLPSFAPDETLDALEGEGITSFFGVPTMYQFLLREPDLAGRDLSAWRVGMFGAAPMPPSAVDELARAVPSVELYNLCGLTEMGPGGVYLKPEEIPLRPGAAGRPIANTEARVADDLGADVAPGEVGELLLRGETLMKGYWNKPEATAEAIREGWLYTGDMAQSDEEGYITLVDRKKDMIITGGMNVYSVEVEGAIASHPDVLDCAVVGAPHPDYGESIVAVVEARPGSELDVDALREHCRPLISDYKLPHRLVSGEIPRNATGKALKYRLREAITKTATQTAEE